MNVLLLLSLLVNQTSMIFYWVHYSTCVVVVSTLFLKVYLLILVMIYWMDVYIETGKCLFRYLDV